MKVAVAFICDEAYVMPTGVAITSLIFHAPDQTDTEYDIYVLGVGISEKSKDVLTSMSKGRFKITVIDCSFDEKHKQIKSNGTHVTMTSTLCFDLPTILPQYDKALYLDSDILVRGSLEELFETDLSDVYAGVVKDVLACRNIKHLVFLNFKPEAYFNSGVMLLNLKKMREDDMPERLLDYRIHGKNFYMDQDALNVVFDGRVKYLSPYYNVFTLWYKRTPIVYLGYFYDVDFPDQNEKIFMKAVVLHFGEHRKPWQVDLGFESGLYYMYYKMSPFANDADMWAEYRLIDKIRGIIKKIKRRIRREITKRK